MKNSNDMKVTKVKVQFVQETKKGESVVNCKPLTIESEKITEISGTIVKHLAYTRLQLARYGARIVGFSFNRKFDVRITINELEPVTLSEVYGLDEGTCRQTLMIRKNTEDKDFSAKNKAVMEDFANKIHDMVFLAMTGDMEVVYELDEAKEEMVERLEAVSPKYLNA